MILLLLIGAAVDHANRIRNVQIRHGLLHQLDALAQAHAFKAARDGDSPLQVLADDLGLATFVLKIRQGTQGRGLAGGAAGDHGVPDLVQGRARVIGKAHANGVGAVIHHHRRGGRLTLQDRAGVEFDLRTAAHAHGAIVKVILETALLNDDQKTPPAL